MHRGDSGRNLIKSLPFSTHFSPESVSEVPRDISIGVKDAGGAIQEFSYLVPQFCHGGSIASDFRRIVDRATYRSLTFHHNLRELTERGSCTGDQGIELLARTSGIFHESLLSLNLERAGITQQDLELLECVTF